MTIRTCVILVAFALTGIASAQFVECAFGRGEVTDQNRETGLFSFVAARFERNGSTVVDGMVEFVTRSNTRALSIRGRVDRLAVDGPRRAAHFAGDGVLAVRTANGFEQFRGRFEVRAVDRERGFNARPDQFAIVFTTANNRTFEFAGLVTRGDLTVRVAP